MLQTRRRHRYLIPLFAALFACTKDRAPATSDLLDVAPAPAPAEISRFSAPLAYDFSAVLRVVERAVPTKFGNLDSVKIVGTDDHRHYAFQAERGPFTAYAEGNLVHLRANLAYAARGFYKPIIGPTVSGGCGTGKPEDRPRILLELATPLTLTPNWHLKSQASLVTVEPASKEQRDRCDVTFLHHDVTAKVLEAAKSGISSHLGDIDKKVADVDLTEKFTSLWALLSKPIRLADGLWLMLNPKGLAIGRVSGRAHVLNIPVTLEARPEIVTTTSEPVVVADALPPLGRDTSSGGFHILIDGAIDYTAASSMMDRALTGKTISQAKQSVTVSGVSVAAASKGRLALIVSFKGDANGAVRFVGTPVYDTLAKEITIPDLDFDIETDNPLINTYSWLRSDAMRSTFREKAQLPADSALSKGKALLLAGLNRKVGDALTLTATVSSVSVRGVFVTRGGIVVRADATGKAGVAVRQR
jgi:hypothetical protein